MLKSGTGTENLCIAPLLWAPLSGANQIQMVPILLNRLSLSITTSPMSISPLWINVVSNHLHVITIAIIGQNTIAYHDMHHYRYHCPSFHLLITLRMNLSWIFFPQPAHSWGPVCPATKKVNTFFWAFLSKQVLLLQFLHVLGFRFQKTRRIPSFYAHLTWNFVCTLPHFFIMSINQLQSAPISIKLMPSINVNHHYEASISIS